MVSANRPRNSKHTRVITEMRERIGSKRLSPGERLPSFAEMRNLYGISPATTDRVYAVLEQEGLVVREQGRGIFVAPPVSNVKGIVGFTGPADVQLRHSPYWMHLLEGIQEVAHGAGFEVLLLRSMTPVWEKMDGILVHGDLADSILSERPPLMPAVSLMSQSAHVPSVLADDMAGTADAVRHLVNIGHKRIGCLMLTQTPLPRRRLAGYHVALQEAGISPDPSWIRPIGWPGGEMTIRTLGRWNMQQWLKDGWAETGCTAILAQNDGTALGVMDALHEAGIKVPGDVSVVGFDDTEECESAVPPLASVYVPLQRIGAAAMKLLLDQINGESAEAATTVLPAYLQVRGSIAPVMGCG